MKKEEILQLFQQFEAVASELEGVECWSARELQKLLGYTKWENFEKVIKKAKDACSNAGEDANNHFPDIRKVIVCIFTGITTGIFSLLNYFFEIFPLCISK